MRVHLHSNYRLVAPASIALLSLLAACSAPTIQPAASPASPAGGAPAVSGAASPSAGGAAASGSPAASASPAANNGQLGMIFEVNNTGWQKAVGAPAKQGMVVVYVVPNQPGAKAGLVEGDVITKMNGHDTINANAANQQIRTLKVADKVSLDLQRKSGPAKVDLTVEPSQQMNLPQTLSDQIAKNPNDARWLFLRGAYGDKDAKSAMDDYTKAIQLNPDFVSAYVERGTLSETSNPDQAMKDFNKAASLDPNYEPLYVNRSVLYSSQKAYDKALEDDKKAVQLDPSDPAAYANLGIGFVNSGDVTQAMAAENQALQKDPIYGPALLYRGLMERDVAKVDLQKASQVIKDPKQKSLADSALQKLS